MSSRDKIAPIRQPVLPVKMLLLPVLCLGGLSAHFLADNFEHFLWQPVAETTGLQADHGDHYEQTALSIKMMPADRGASVQRAPLLHPPKFS